MLRLCPHGTVFGYEPLSENVAYLRHRYPNAMVQELAVSDSQGEAVFYRVNGRPARSGLRRQNLPDPGETFSEIRVKTDTLDNTVPESTPISFLKIDVEGAELNVLKGALNLLKRDRPKIVFEYQPAFSAEYGYGPTDIFDFLADKAGMEVHSMDRWLENRRAFTKQDFLDTVNLHHEFYFLAC
jgi:FkbM family methyltransferase